MRTCLSMAAALILLAGVPADAANLCVKTGGNNSTAKADLVYVAGDEAGSTCWASIGRAAWGSATRSSPVSAEAAAAGDTVYIFGATYNSTLNIDDNSSTGVLYNPVNAGSSGNPIRFVAVGDVTLTCGDCESPAVGGSRNYVEWYADISLGHSWIIHACAEDPSTGGEDCPLTSYFTITPDTGPVNVGATGGVVEGFVLTAEPAPYGIDENYPAIRLQGSMSSTIRNNDISGFVLASFPNSTHGVCINLYDSEDNIIEHNRCQDSGECLSFKDNGPTMNLEGNIFRLNWCEGLNSGVAYSLQSTGTEDRNYVYQNVFKDIVGYVINIGTSTNDWVFNNTAVGSANACVAPGNSQTGFRFWGNICTGSDTAIFSETALDVVADFSTQHNAYFGYTGNFYDSEVDPSRATLAAFIAVHTTQETDAPASIDSDPRFANSAASDYRLCTGAGTPHASCAGASPAIALSVDIYDLDGDASTVDTIPAGAYITGNETVGLLAVAGTATGRSRSRSRHRGLSTRVWTIERSVA